MMAVTVERMAAAVIAMIMMTKEKRQPLRWHRQQWLWRRPRQRKATADATSVNCNGKRVYGNNNGDGTTARVMATMKATATAMATAMGMVAMWWGRQWQWRWRRQRRWRRLKSCWLVWFWCDVCGVDICFIIVIQLPLACESRGRSFASSFYYMRWEPVPMFFVVFVPDILVELLVQDLRTLLGIHSTIVPCGDLVELWLNPRLAYIIGNS